jgi:cell wall-associated NlpC family hydrolase
MPDDVQSAVDALIESKWADARLTVFAVQAESTGNTVRLTGDVLTAEQQAEAERAVRQAAPELQVVNDIAVLSRPDNQWALVKRGLSNLRRSPGNGAELLAQGLFGEPVELLKHDADKGWWFARLEDGYLGWLVESSLYVCNRDEARAYRASADALVEAELATTYSGLLVQGGMPPEGLRAGKLPFGVPVKVAERRMGLARINWEGEPSLWVAEDDLLPMAERPRPGDAGIARTLELMGRFIGVPYLWGGETPFGYDCSGFAQTTMEFMGLHVPRDADQQFVAGQPVEGEPQPGDLLFFSDTISNPADPQAGRVASITHVAVSLGGTEFIHATGHVWGVTRNSLDPASPIYRAWLKEHLAGARRFV